MRTSTAKGQLSCSQGRFILPLERYIERRSRDFQRYFKKNSTDYHVDGEIGRFSFEVYSKVDPYGEAFYNTGREFFTPLQGEEKYLTEGFKEVALIYGTTEISFRKSAALINRIRYQENGGTPYSTLNDITETEGSEIQNHLNNKSLTIIESNHFINEIKTIEAAVDSFIVMPSELESKEIGKIVEGLPIEESLKPQILNNPVPYELPWEAVNICLDDVGAKEQKTTREKKALEKDDGITTTTRKKRKYVQNTVIHVEHKEKFYLLNGYGIFYVLRLLLAFLLHNDLHEKVLVFYIDGHSLYSKVLQYFSWHKRVIIILDWYHLQKKCAELLSMALAGRKIRNEVLAKIKSLLWHGLVDETISYLSNLPADKIKNKKEITHLIKYLRKNRPMIPAYSVRKKVGLGNSSNRGEKANELLVSQRQKHKGMSWSKSGSVSLASITALSKNKEHKRWFQDGEIDFKLAS